MNVMMVNPRILRADNYVMGTGEETKAWAFIEVTTAPNNELRLAWSAQRYEDLDTLREVHAHLGSVLQRMEEQVRILEEVKATQ